MKHSGGCDLNIWDLEGENVRKEEPWTLPHFLGLLPRSSRSYQQMTQLPALNFEAGVQTSDGSLLIAALSSLGSQG